MDVVDTIWCVPSKYIHDTDQDITLYFDNKKKSWMFNYDKY